MGFAVLHVGGAFLASFAFGLLVLVIGAWEKQSVEKRRLQEMAISLGVPVTSLENEEMVPKVIQYSSARHSGELLRNRFADLCGIVRTSWGYLSHFAQVVAIGLVGWQMYDSGSENAVLMWSVPALAFFFWLMSVLFSFACLLVTGRYPGEPKASRSALAAFIEQRGATSYDSSRPLTAAWEA